jgi:NADPH2:quinone reductase
MRAEKFSGYEELKVVNLPKPTVSDGKVLLRMTAAGVTPLDHTILSGQFPPAKAPLVLGNEGAGVVEEGGGTDFPAGSRVMFTGPYGVFEDGTYSEWLAVRKESLCMIPKGVDDVSAAGIPVAYLTAQMALTLAGFQAGKTVLAPAIGGSVGNAVTQLARALGAKHAMSSTTNHAKAVPAVDARLEIQARSTPRILAFPKFLSPRFLLRAPIFNDIQLGIRLHPFCDRCFGRRKDSAAQPRLRRRSNGLIDGF